jgi:hypothetical protein
MLGRLLRLGLLGAGGAAVARALKAKQARSAPDPAEQPLRAQPDQLPNEPDRPAGATPPPTGRATPGGAA